jgi:hypothetical protein
VRGRGAAGSASAEEQSARPFFWQDEHAVQRQHIFVHGAEGELAGARPMGSLGSPSALFLVVDTEASFMDRLEAEAAALRGRLEGVQLRDLARCDAVNAAEAAGAAKAVETAEAAGGAGTGPPGSGGAGPESGGDDAASSNSSEPPCKKRRVYSRPLLGGFYRWLAFDAAGSNAAGRLTRSTHARAVGAASFAGFRRAWPPAVAAGCGRGLQSTRRDGQHTGGGRRHGCGGSGSASRVLPPLPRPAGLSTHRHVRRAHVQAEGRTKAEARQHESERRDGASHKRSSIAL